MKLAVDVGGTFTDLVIQDEHTGTFEIVKCPSTPDGFERGVLSAVSELPSERLSGDVSFIHGSTIVINHLLERKGAKTGLLTTKGFRDVLDIQRTNRPDLYNLRYQKPKPFVAREHRFEIDERIGPDGRIIKSLDLTQLDSVIEQISRGGYDAVAVAFINAYQNAEHEEAVAERIRLLLPDIYVCISSQIRLWREYERTNTVVASSYVGPAVANYLSKLEDGLLNYGIGRVGMSSPSMMLSNGGRTTFHEAKAWPINLVESGPAAGITGACVIGKRLNIPDFIALDVGGTTAKAALVEGGQPQRLQEYVIEGGRAKAGHPLLVPTVDITEVGAGGGSIVRVTEDGAIRIGPDSAGANPGPACYGRGGTSPTITDANFLAGRLPETLAQGMPLHRHLAEQAFQPLVDSLDMSLEDVVQGVLRMAESRMASVLQLATVARGKDPRRFHLIAYGGSAPLHAAEMAKQLRIPSVIIPPRAGVFAAWGMVHAPYLLDKVKTVVIPWPSGASQLEREVVSLGRDAEASLIKMGQVCGHTEVRLDVRYVGQARSLAISGDDLTAVATRFTEVHQEKYGFVMDAPIEVTEIHIIASDSVQVRTGEISKSNGEPSRDSHTSSRGQRTVLTADGYRVADVYRRESLDVGDIIFGPAIVEEETTTTYLPPDQQLQVDVEHNLIIIGGGLDL